MHCLFESLQPSYEIILLLAFYFRDEEQDLQSFKYLAYADRAGKWGGGRGLVQASCLQAPKLALLAPVLSGTAFM